MVVVEVEGAAPVCWVTLAEAVLEDGYVEQVDAPVAVGVAEDVGVVDDVDGCAVVEDEAGVLTYGDGLIQNDLGCYWGQGLWVGKGRRRASREMVKSERSMASSGSTSLVACLRSLDGE